MPANDAKVTLLRSAEIGAGLMPSPYVEAVMELADERERSDLLIIENHVMRERIRELEAAPTSAEVEAMVALCNATAEHCALDGSPDEEAAYRQCATLLRSLSRQVAAKDAEIARLTSDRDAKSKRMWELGHECERAEAERDALRAEVNLLTHKIITCGVAAEHPNADLTKSGAYKDKWDSPQAERVRKLRAEVAGLRRDAQRYRWLRQVGQQQDFTLGCAHYNDELDAAIDAALRLARKVAP